MRWALCVGFALIAAAAAMVVFILVAAIVS